MVNQTRLPKHQQCTAVAAVLTWVRTPTQISQLLHNKRRTHCPASWTILFPKYHHRSPHDKKRFLDTQVSLAPTHVRWSVRPKVSQSHFWISNLWSPFCATVVFEDPTAMLLGSPSSPKRSTPSPRRSIPSPRRSTPSPRRSTPSPSFFQNCR